MCLTEQYPILKNLERILKDYGAKYSLTSNFSCLFHDDKTPSANIYIDDHDKQCYKCFSCNRHYDSVALFENLYPQKDKTYLFMLYHIPTSGSSRPESDNTKISSSSPFLNSVKQQKLHNTHAQESLAYAKKRGIKKAFHKFPCTFEEKNILYPQINSINRVKPIEGKDLGVKKGEKADISFCSQQSSVVVITEGIFDMLSILEVSDYCDVVSLNGVNNARKCVEWLLHQQYQGIILFCDCDSAGRDAANLIQEEYPRGNFLDISDHITDKYKDPNECLVNDPEFLATLLKKSIKKIKEGDSLAGEKYKESFLMYLSQKKEIFKSGFEFADYSGGLTGLVTIGGVTGLGKTTFIINMLRTLLKSHPVVFYSMEMTKHEIFAKFISLFLLEKNHVSVSYFSILNKSQEEIIANNQVLPLYGYIKNILNDYGFNDIMSRLTIIEGRVSVSRLQKDCDEYALLSEKPIIILDYIQILQSDKTGTDKQIMDSKVEALLTMRDKLETPIICVSSFNRNAYRQALDFSSFKESGSIEFSSNQVIGIQKYALEEGFPENDANKQYVVAKMLKNRSGICHSQVFKINYQAGYYEKNIPPYGIIIKNMKNNTHYQDFKNYFKNIK